MIVSTVSTLVRRPDVKFWFFTFAVMGFIVPMLLGMTIGYAQTGVSQSVNLFVKTSTALAFMPDLHAVPWYVMAGHLFVNNTICMTVMMLIFYITRKPESSLARGIAFMILPYQALIGGIVMGGLLDRMGPGFVIAAIVPHGIVEIPVFCFAIIAGLLLGEMNVEYGIDVRSALVACAVAIAGLVAVAAGIEAVITPAVIQIVAGMG